MDRLNRRRAKQSISAEFRIKLFAMLSAPNARLPWSGRRALPIRETLEFMRVLVTVTSTTRCDKYSHATLHCRTFYMYSLRILIRAFPSEGRTAWVRRYCNLARVLRRTVLRVTPGPYRYAQLIQLAR
jgi:hypothetical protein